jgi:hypothetical protein
MYRNTVQKNDSSYSFHGCIHVGGIKVVFMLVCIVLFEKQPQTAIPINNSHMEFGFFAPAISLSLLLSAQRPVAEIKLRVAGLG